MLSTNATLMALVCMSAALLAACREDSQSPPARPEPPLGQETPEGTTLVPLDLVYVCGNKFLAINSTRGPVHVTYRVVGTDETGGLTLREGSGDDEGHSETELTTAERGVVELYQDDQRVARRLNRGVPCGASPLSAVAGVAGVESGSWSAPFPWPIVALHLSLLPNGKLLSWGHTGKPQIWNPGTGDFTEIPEPVELFCSGHSFLPDGRLLVAGGHIDNGHGLPTINIFSPSGQNWSSSTPMRRGRWYPTNTTLGSGEVVIMAGRDQAGARVAEPEVWSSGTVRVLSTASRLLPYYPRAFLAPNGMVFYAGEEQSSGYLDPAGTGSWTTVGDRLYGDRNYGAAVMYDVGKILYVGGGRTTNTAEIIDLSSAAPTWQWTGSMANARRHLNATVLPTGEVLVTGGSRGTNFNDVALGVRAAEVWNPGSGVWKTLAGNSVNRTYHATSLLLPDGRVLHTGSGDGAGAPGERNAELFSPPYLFKGPRPAMTSAPSLVAYGTSFPVGTSGAAEIAQVSLIRIGSTTHGFDMNQRFQWLSFERESGSLTVAAPANRNHAPPGHYMLFIVDGNGVPSEAKIVKLGSESEPAPPANVPPVASFAAGCKGFTCTFTDGSTDDGTVKGWSWEFGDGGSATDQNPSHTFPGEGSYEVTLIATDNDDATGTVTKTVTVTPPPPNTAPTAAFTQTCHGFTCGFADGSTDDGTLKGWSWDFGDGGSAAAQNPSHTFPGEGSYEVTLIATDNDDATGTVTKTVTVTPPPPNTAPTAAFTQACDGFTCGFTDGSTDDDGMVKGWSWAFGEGEGAGATDPNPTHTYDAVGSYEVTLIVTDNDDATGSVTKTIIVTPPPPNTAPTAAFIPTCEGLSCGFTDGSTDDDGTVKGWSWDFGDGATATAQNPSHTYAAGGSYQVTLITTDNDDETGTVTKTVAVTPPPVPNAAPTAAFTQTCNGLTCTFTDGSTDADGTVIGWSWNLGDGASATTQNPGHTYAAGGTYAVTLQVTDDDDGTNQRSTSLTVTRPASIVLSAAGRVDATKQYMTLTWSGARGARVNVYRNGAFFKSEVNDGQWINSRLLPGASSYTYKVCELGTTICSNQATVQFGSPPPASIVLSVTGQVDATKQYMTLTWSGARGARVNVYRGGPFYKSEVNDGRWINSRLLPGASRYTYKVCEVGTTICSNEATVVFR